MTSDEAQGGFGPFKLAVKGPITILVVAMACGFGLLAWQVDKTNAALAKSADALTAARSVAKGEHDSILFGQQSLVRAQEDSTCMLALPADVRPAAVAWTRTSGLDNVKWRSVCDYVVTVYLAPRRP